MESEGGSAVSPGTVSFKGLPRPFSVPTANRSTVAIEVECMPAPCHSFLSKCYRVSSMLAFQSSRTTNILVMVAIVIKVRETTSRVRSHHPDSEPS